MTTEDARAAVIAFWGDKAAEALQSAQSEFAAGRLSVRFVAPAANPLPQAAAGRRITSCPLPAGW